MAFLKKWELNVASWIETKNQGLIAVITVNEVVWKASEKHAQLNQDINETRYL